MWCKFPQNHLKVHFSFFRTEKLQLLALLEHMRIVLMAVCTWKHLYSPCVCVCVCVCDGHEKMTDLTAIFVPLGENVNKPERERDHYMFPGKLSSRTAFLISLHPTSIILMRSLEIDQSSGTEPTVEGKTAVVKCVWARERERERERDTILKTNEHL